MKSYLFIVFLFTIFSCTNSLDNSNKESDINHKKKPESNSSTSAIIDTVFFDYNSRINWKDFEVEINLEIKNKFLSKFDSIYNYVKNDEFYGEKYDSMFHFLHLNGDSLIDVIFEGWSGGEPYVCEFYFNTGETFELQFQALQYITQMEIEDKRLKSFKIIDFGCCAEYVHWEKQYEIKNDTINILLKRAKINATIKPENYFKTPKKFIVNNASYFLRFEPEINNDTLYAPYYEGEGNKVAEYFKGDLGIAYAEKSDSTGRNWWFVEMEPKLEFRYNIIYNSQNDRPKYLGWMSSRFVKEIN